MLKLIVLTLFLSTSAFGESWEGCSDANQPIECGKIDEKFTANENSCLLKLYTCGRYDRIVERISTLNKGLAPEHNYYLGVAYFGLSNRTDAQSLKCHYFRQAKAQLDEFLIATNADPSTNVSYGADQRIDILYQATRIFGLLKKETGCSESSFSEGEIYRIAQLKTQEQIKRVLHDSDGNDEVPSGANTATRNGFQGMRDNLNSIITATSQLESRFYLYRSQIDVSKGHLKLLADQMHSEFGEFITAKTNGDLPEVNVGNMSEYMAPIRADLQSGLTMLQDYQAKVDLYMLKEGAFYNSIRQDKLASVNNLNRSFVNYTNSFRVNSEAALSIKKSLDSEEAGSKVPVLLSGPILGLFEAWRGKDRKNCPVRNKPWYC